jgi:hypothetical protein
LTGKRRHGEALARTATKGVGVTSSCLACKF